MANTAEITVPLRRGYTRHSRFEPPSLGEVGPRHEGAHAGIWRSSRARVRSLGPTACEGGSSEPEPGAHVKPPDDWVTLDCALAERGPPAELLSNPEPRNCKLVNICCLKPLRWGFCSAATDSSQSRGLGPGTREALGTRWHARAVHPCLSQLGVWAAQTETINKGWRVL